MPNQEWLRKELQNTCYPVVKSGVNSAPPVPAKRSQRKSASPAQTTRKRCGRGQRDLRFR